MFFLKFWYGFLDRMADKKFRITFLLSLAGVFILAAVIAAVAVFSKDNDLEAGLPYTDSDEENALIINGIDVDGMSIEEIEELFMSMAEDYSISVYIAGKEAGVINGEGIDFKYNEECNLDKYLSGNETDTEKETEKIKKSAKSESKETDTEISSESETENMGVRINDLWTYDKEKLNAEIDNILISIGGEDFLKGNAVLEYSEENGFSIAAGKDGRYFDSEAVRKEIMDAVDNCACNVSIDDNTAYKDLDVNTHNKLSEAVNTLNSYMNSVLNYNFNGELKVIDKAKIHDWFYLDEDLNVCIDNDAVQIYTSKLAEAFTDNSKTTPFLTSYGGYINLRTASSNKVDEDTLFNYLIEDIVSGATVNRTIPYIETNDSAASNNFGGTYVEINLTKQHLFLYYEGNRILDCDIVSGCVAKDYTTPGGVFKIRYKKQNATLKGADYSTPVDFWMPFNGGIGLHDASWRTEFGGDIYLTDGSHGCINMPHEAVSVLYQYAYAGMYVIVYGGAESVNDAAAQEAASQEGTEAATAAVTSAATKAPAVHTTKAPAATTESPKPVVTEALTEALTEAFTEEQKETQEETEPSGEVSSEAVNE